MKKFTFTLLTILCMVGITAAQNTFSVIPNPAYCSGDSTEPDVGAIAKIKNLTTVSQTYTWVRHEITLPPGFRTGVCDCITCYKETLGTATFTMDPNEECLLEVHFYNNSGTTGTGIVHLKLTNNANAADSLTAVFIYNSTSGTKDLLPVADVRLFPNPVTDLFTLEHADNIAAVRIYSLDGRQVAYLQPTSDGRYSLAGQPAGTYIVALLAKNGQAFQAIEVKKK